MKQRRVLILYATMSSNTEKIAKWFQEVFDAYNWEVNLVRIRNQRQLAEQQDSLYFDDYDVVCLGSPIVAGAPLQPVIRAFSLGGGEKLEEAVSKDAPGKMPEQPPKGKWRRQDHPMRAY